MLPFLSSDAAGILRCSGKVKVTTALTRLHVWLKLAGWPALGLIIPMEANWKWADKNLHRLPGRLAGDSVFLSPALESQLLASSNRFIGWLKRAMCETGCHASEKWTDPAKQLTRRLVVQKSKAMVHGGRMQQLKSGEIFSWNVAAVKPLICDCVKYFVALIRASWMSVPVQKKWRIPRGRPFTLHCEAPGMENHVGETGIVAQLWKLITVNPQAATATRENSINRFSTAWHKWLTHLFCDKMGKSVGAGSSTISPSIWVIIGP